MLRHRTNAPLVSPLEATAVVMEAADICNTELKDGKNNTELPPDVVIHKDAGPAINKLGKKRGGGISGKTTESTFSSLLQPIFALFPPSQSSGPLAPAFELDPSPKDTNGKQSTGTSTKAKNITRKDDEDAFVIYQPASWSAKRPKLSAARMAVTFDWKNDVFGPSPNAVHGQRTKHPKQHPASVPLVREVGPPIQHSVLLRGMLRDRAGSLASMSDVSSFASTGEEELDSFLLTPAHNQTLADFAVVSRSTLSSTLEDSLALSEPPTSPTGAIVERFSTMGVTSPKSGRPIHREQSNDDGDEEMNVGSTPHTPLTPRSIPDSDEDSDDE